jgi:hypothetical protein
MTYDHGSTSNPMTALGGGWLWIYDVATTNGPEVLQVSASSGQVVDTVAMPTLYRPIMAANDDGLWLGPFITGGGPATLYRVGSRSHTATVVVSGRDSVCWLLGSGHHLWAGIGPTCIQQTITRFDGTDLKPAFEVADRGYEPGSVVGNEIDGLWTMQWMPPLGTTIPPPSPRPQDIVRIDPDSGAESIIARLPPVAFPISPPSNAGLADGQAVLSDGSLYLLEPPLRQGGYNGYSSLVRVALSR